jgi:5-methylcytosine-specific restriction protein A
MDTVELVKWINKLIQHNNIKAFYNSGAWQHLRQEVLDDQHHECQICKDKGLYSEAETVHHIKYVRQHPELALTKVNLIAVCEDCHYNIHHRAELKPQLNVERW